MRIMKRNRGLRTFGAAAVGVLALAGAAAAQEYRNVTSERSGSMVVFPKVVWSEGRDTIIRLANTSNPLAFVHCVYVDKYCGETDFDLILTRQQPTHWSASNGRRAFLNPADWGTDSSGLPPGLIPPVAHGFEGQLICLQVDSEGFPFPGNALKGEAVLRSEDGDVSRYNAVSFPANPENPAEPTDPVVLRLDLTPDNGGQYTACPDTLVFNHFREGSPDRVAVQAAEQVGSSCEETTGGNCSVSTELTLVPCTIDLENQQGGFVRLKFTIYDEFEQPQSANLAVSCWWNNDLNAINPVFSTLATPSAYTRITPVPGDGGVIAIAEETRYYGWATGKAAFNVHGEGNRFDRATDGTCPSTPNPDACRVEGVLDTVTVPAP